jgi:hypothetical protein
MIVSGRGVVRTGFEDDLEAEGMSGNHFLS